MLALPIFPGRLQPSIVSRNELNYCVRNGNRWDLCVIGTGYEYANAKAISLALGYSLFFEGACTLKTEQCYNLLSFLNPQLEACLLL